MYMYEGEGVCVFPYMKMRVFMGMCVHVTC